MFSHIPFVSLNLILIYLCFVKLHFGFLHSGFAQDFAEDCMSYFQTCFSFTDVYLQNKFSSRIKLTLKC